MSKFDQYLVGESRDYPLQRCIHQLFEDQVARTPDAVAVMAGAEQLTYRQLDRCANQLAHQLQALGVGPDRLVGLFVERSFSMVVGMLATLKAGGAYVPLDPDYPADRLALMLDQSEAMVVLTVECLRGALPAGSHQVISIDSAPVSDDQWWDDPPVSDVCSEHLAYLVFTSGSTGHPKGVMVPHRALVNHMCWMLERFPLTQNDRVLQKTAFSFDASVWEFYAPILAGACLVIAEPGGQHDPAYLIETIVHHRITTLQVVPTLLRMLLEERGFSDCTSLKRVFCGGEALPVSLAERFAATLRADLYNLYGPSEVTVDSTVCEYEPDYSGSTVPIGRPIFNLYAHVLDTAMQSVIPGEVGELYLGGLGVARGYWNRPNLTAERFLPDPFSAQPGARLYMTGDLVRQRPNGNLEFVGRVDHQVKVRGYRIELEEIEAVFRQHPAIREAVVVPIVYADDDVRLVVYLLVLPGAQLAEQQLRQWAKERLPGYMLPATHVRMETLPLMPNGKVNRKALPPPELVSAALTAPEELWATPTEGILAQIWANVFRREQVGLRDHFFDLGGHSLLATQVMARIHAAFGISLPVRVLFEAPTVAELALRVDQATHGSTGSNLAATPVKLGSDREVPLSFAQQRIWFMDQIEPGNPMYNEPAGWRLTGCLSVEALERSLNEIVRRHETLRTTFVNAEGRPLALVAPPSFAPLLVIDLTDTAPLERESRAHEWLKAEGRKPFDLTIGPLFRARLLRLGAHDHLLFICMHHIVCDGWSMSVLEHELAEFYTAFAGGHSPKMDELPIRYQDYAQWQRQWLDGEVLQKQQAYWTTQLGGALPVLELPADRPRPPVMTYQGDAESILLPADLLVALQRLSRAEGSTLFTTLLAAFQTLLYRYTGQTDVSVGAPIANRTRTETEGLIGFFVNTVVLRSDLTGNPSFRSFLARVRQNVLGALANQDFPFEKLVEALRPNRDLSHTSLFQVMLVHRNLTALPTQWPEVSLQRVPVHTGSAKFDMTLMVQEEPDGLWVTAVYNTSLFERPTIRRVLGHLNTLLQGLVADPDQRLSELPMLPEHERRELLVERNDSAAAYNLDVCLHNLFEAQVERTPDAPAVIFEGRDLTYRELNQTANRLAAVLTQAGTGPGQLVGLFLDRSLEMIVGMLGILKAGGAYVPMDLAFPMDRLEYLLSDTAVSVVLTVSELADRLPGHTARVICLDRDQGEMAGQTSSKPANRARPEDLAYVLYTSGSTGRPKGVAIEHRQIVNYVQAVIDRFAFTPGASFAMVQPAIFDSCNTVIYPALLSGGSLHIISKERALDPQALGDYFRRWPIDCMKITPSHLAALLNSANPAQVLPRRWLIIGGEASRCDWVAWLRSIATCAVFNHYGPTETTVGVLTYDTATEALRPANTPTIPLGRPLPNIRAYVLDANLQPVPVGVPGELFIGGAGVGRGYLNNPAVTAEKFLPDPFNPMPGQRMYRTGDLAQYLPGREIEFLGRKDDQVKIRGFRIELGEIIAVLSEHPRVLEALVVAQEITPGDKRLVAYIVTDGDGNGDRDQVVREVRHHARERLPEYMVPVAMIVLDAFPRTLQGKVDRRALPLPADAIGEGMIMHASPRTADEELMAVIWAEVLGLARVGRNDHFFQLGGHSLLATQVVARVREVLRVELPLRAVFESPILEELAQRVDSARRLQNATVLPAIMPCGLQGELPLSYAQQRLWFFDQLQPDSPLYNLTTVFHLTGSVQLGALEQSLAMIVQRHDSLRSMIVMKDGQAVQRVKPMVPVRLQVVDLAPMPESDRAIAAGRLVQEQATSPFDLSQGSLFRFQLLRMGHADHRLLLSFHHIIADGWSIGVFLRELFSLYQGLSAGRPTELAALPVQYADYAVWQRQWLQGPVLEQLTAYWRTQLNGMPHVLEVPTDRPRPDVQTYQGELQRMVVPQTVAEGLRRLSQSAGTTVFMTFLAAFKALLYRYTGMEDMVVGVPVANRTSHETEGLIGFFANTLVMRTHLSGNPTVRELLRRVRNVTLGALSHQELPFDLLVERLQPRRDPSRTPLVQILFAYAGAPDMPVALPGLTVSTETVYPGTAKFDLILYVREVGGDWWAELEYNIDLYDHRTGYRILADFIAVLEAVVANPDDRLLALSLTANDTTSDSGDLDGLFES